MIVGKLLEINICRAKGVPRESIGSAIFKADFGLVGDAYSGRGDKQVTILSQNDRIQLDKSFKNGLCVKRFKETLLIDYYDGYKEIIEDSLKKGDIHLKIGDVVIEITKVGKRCFEDCELVKEGVKCPLATGAMFGRILEGGSLSINNSIEILT